MKLLLAVLIGGGVGFALGHFGRCGTGVCPLTSNPVISTIVGAVIGLLIVAGR